MPQNEIHVSHYPPAQPWFPVIDLWKGFRLPPIFGRPHLLANLLTAGETGAAAFYLSRLRTLTNGENSRRRLRIWKQWTWAVAAGSPPCDGVHASSADGK